jgi:hypothetical protein
MLHLNLILIYTLFSIIKPLESQTSSHQGLCKCEFSTFQSRNRIICNNSEAPIEQNCSIDLNKLLMLYDTNNYNNSLYLSRLVIINYNLTKMICTRRIRSTELVINLSQNQIKHLDDASRGCLSSNIVHMNLSSNLISMIGKNYFHSLHNLRLLDLSKNNLITLSLDFSFDSVRFLIRIVLSGNVNLKRIEHLKFASTESRYSVSIEAQNLNIDECPLIERDENNDRLFFFTQINQIGPKKGIIFFDFYQNKVPTNNFFTCVIGKFCQIITYYTNK